MEICVQRGRRKAWVSLGKPLTVTERGTYKGHEIHHEKWWSFPHRPEEHEELVRRKAATSRNGRRA